MKITIEIPNFEIYPANDGTETDFVKEIRDEVIKVLAQRTISHISANDFKISNAIKNASKEIEEKGLAKIEEVLAYHMEQTDKFIKGLK